MIPSRNFEPESQGFLQSSWIYVSVDPLAQATWNFSITFRDLESSPLSSQSFRVHNMGCSYISLNWSCQTSFSDDIREHLLKFSGNQYDARCLKCSEYFHLWFNRSDNEMRVRSVLRCLSWLFRQSTIGKTALHCPKIGEHLGIQESFRRWNGKSRTNVRWASNASFKRHDDGDSWPESLNHFSLRNVPNNFNWFFTLSYELLW